MRSLSILLVLALGASATKKPCPPPPCPANQIMKGGHCVPACRDGEILLNNHQCVCGPGTEKDKKGACQPKCPDGTKKDEKGTCQPIKSPPGPIVCPYGTEKDEKGICQPIPCPKGMMYINYHCQCPDPSMKWFNNDCQCPPGKEKDAKGTCQPIICPPRMELINNHCQCPDQQVFHEGKCVCPPGMEKDAKGTCQTTCPIPCPKGMVLINSHCQCPDPSMKWINNDCQCPDSQVFHEGKCVCPPGMEKDAKGTCQTCVCDYGMEKNEKGICQPIPCPKGMMYINYHCQCPDPSMKWFNNDCQCPDQQYLLEGKCVCLPGMEKSANGTCIPKCPPGTDRLANGSCSDLHCLEGQFEVNGHCVWRPCPNNLERIGNKCGCKLPAVEVREDPCGDSKCFTPPCPRGEVRQTNGTCVNFCKDGYILVKGVCTCHLPHEKPICGDGERLDSNIDECVCKDGLTRQHPDYTCKPPKPLGGPAKCPSGIQTGKSLCNSLLGGYAKC